MGPHAHLAPLLLSSPDRFNGSKKHGRSQAALQVGRPYMVVKRMRTDLVTNWACVGFPMTTDGEGILHATIIHNFPPWIHLAYIDCIHVSVSHLHYSLHVSIYSTCNDR